MDTFQDKVVVVTGGNSGVGYATAKEFAAQGATVVITGRRKEAIEAAAAEIGAVPMLSDQGKLKDINTLCAAVADRFGKVDVLFINAGTTGTMGLIENAQADNFDTVMDINFRGAYFTLSRFIPLLRDGASVIILSSIVASTHKANSSIYQASKAALNSVAKTAAAELAPRNIRVNIVSPGPHETEILNKAGLDEATLQHIKENLIGQIPLRKIGAATDVAKIVVSLCDDRFNFTTGAEIVVDGGMTL